MPVKKAKTEPKALKLENFTDPQLKELSHRDLIELSKNEEISWNHSAEQLVANLICKKHGQSQKYICRRTICKFCGAPIRVMGTQRKTMEDGRVLVTRSVKCIGRHRHSYPLKEIIGNSKPT